MVNDPEKFGIYFFQYENYDLKDIYTGVNCVDLINDMPGLSEQEKESMISEVVFQDFMQCPNVTSFEVRGQELADFFFTVNVVLNNGASLDPDVGKTIIYLADISHFFNAEDYRENGYQEAITLS